MKKRLQCIMRPKQASYEKKVAVYNETKTSKL